MGAGFSVLGEGDLDAEKPARNAVLTCALRRPIPSPTKAAQEERGKSLFSEQKLTITGFELPDIEELSVFRHGVTKAEQSTDPVQVRADGSTS